jgi:hypothetical protein
MVCLGDHLKSGQWGSPENRPMGLTQDKLIYTLPAGVWQWIFYSRNKSAWALPWVSPIWGFEAGVGAAPDIDR